MNIRDVEMIRNAIPSECRILYVAESQYKQFMILMDERPEVGFHGTEIRSASLLPSHLALAITGSDDYEVVRLEHLRENHPPTI